MKYILILFVFLLCENSVCQTDPSNVQLPKLKLSDYRHNEHLLCDTLSQYYSKLDFEELNKPQKVFHVLGNDCDLVFSNSLIALLQNKPDSILLIYKSTYEAIKYQPLQDLIKDIQLLYSSNKSYFDTGKLPPQLDSQSNLFNERFELEVDILETDLVDKQCGICTSVALDLIIDYLLKEKRFLILE